MKTLTVGWHNEASDPMARAQTVLGRELQERAGVSITAGDAASSNLILEWRPALAADAFAIESHGAALRIAGQSPAGLMHGVGRFLRDGRWDSDGFTPGAWRGVLAPQAPVRGMYLAFNFDNWYVSCPREKLARYLDDLALWGFNTIVILPLMADPNDRPAFERRVADTRLVLRMIKASGMNAGFLVAPNYGFPNIPPAALASAVPDTTPARRGNAAPGCETRICPSHPVGKAFLHAMLDRLVGGYEDIGLDVVVTFPYDFGGCGCTRCRPWGARGFVTLCRDFSRIVRARYPACRFIVGTWCYDVLGAREGEFAGLDRALRETNDWCDGIMADSHESFPRYPLEQGVPGGLPLLNFPEISMWGRYPWGGYGANPLPQRFERLWGEIKHLCQGGFPYSEGIFEDINKVVVSRTGAPDAPPSRRCRARLAAAAAAAPAAITPPPPGAEDQ